jgi:bifunctional non-homologous end joining protein LigD
VGLRTYRAKRDFERTTEPRGGRARSTRDQLSFVVQKHAARRLHYDFRLEIDGTLKSWAIPKGPSLDPRVKRLAVQVEDHPLEYGTFEGAIPEHQYGAGKVIVWDRGTWVPSGNPEAAYLAGHLDFALDGEKLHGGWALVRIKGKDGESKQPPWLLIKRDDVYATRGKAGDVTLTRPESVQSGRLIDAADRPEPARPRTAKRVSGKSVRAAIGREHATPVALPATLQPQLATLVTQAPAGDDWVYEIKFDGYRILARIENGKVELRSRNGNDWTSRMPDVADALRKLKTRSAWLDGEVVVLDRAGRSVFQLLQNAFSDSKAHAPFVYCLFDLPFADGHDLRALPLLERKARLQALLTGVKSAHLAFSAHAAGDGRALLAQACANGLEGLMAKRTDSTYLSTRTRTWLKLKCHQRQEFVIGGYTDPGGSRAGFGALLVGVHRKDGALRYAGKVGTGFDTARLESLKQTLAGLEQDTAPFIDPPRGYGAKGVHWLKPVLVAEISFAQWTDEGLLRQAVFHGLREDKAPGGITMERATKNMQPKAEASAQFSGIRITHPDRVIFDEAGFTKGDLAAYYTAAASRILPQLAGRPLSLVRCPDGIGKSCFYQKHALKGVVGVDTVIVEESDGEAPYMIVNSREALISLVQMGTVELHTWGATQPRLDRPDRMIFDLDPDEGLDWKSVVEGARLMRTALDELGLQSLLKTTGGKGLHVVVPLARRHDWDEVKQFSGAVAEHVAGVAPERFTANMAKARRKGRIFIDYLRNDRGATAIAAYSVRARPGATVSMPIAWEELDLKMPSSFFTLRNVAARLQSKVDPWSRYRTLKQTLTASMKRALQAASRR